ncbi:unnamed protein product [Pelagomonas calceolata]|uniref:Uncharacterized protein n=1 Tax=Pelagomonas calceolata TaxID=35677 RepID=A0A8J2SC74_9STRA|nr:unnamed protein product [Pelagomonas calceolata]
MWGRSTTAVRECPRVDVRPSCWRRYQVGGGVVGRPRWYFGQPQYRCPGARDYGFAEARLCSRNLRRAVTRHDGGVRRRSK